MRRTKLLSLLTALALCCLCLPVPALAKSGQEDGELPNKVNTSWVEEEPQPLTPEGNMTLVDDTSKTIERDFLTVTTRNGHYFYLIVDRAKNGENNVHFLNQVDESDLLAIIEDGDEAKQPVVCTCDDKCYPGHVDTSCPVCAVNMSECMGREPEPVKPEEPAEPEPEPAPEPVKRSGTNPAVAVILALAVAGGGAVYFLKFRSPKQDTRGAANLDDYDYGFEDDPDGEDETPEGEDSGPDGEDNGPEDGEA